MIENILWGLWNGLTAWPLLLLHAVSIWEQYPVYHLARDGGWYQLGFLLGAGSPFFGMFGKHRDGYGRRSRWASATHRAEVR